MNEEQINLKEYVKQLKKHHSEVYYITVESIAAASSSPFLEPLRKQGLGVVYMVESVVETNGVQPTVVFGFRIFLSRTWSGATTSS